MGNQVPKFDRFIMSWRTVVVTKRCKLDYQMGFMVIRGEETRRIFIDEIAVLVLEDTAISLTGVLLEALINQKIKVIICDNKRSPLAEVVPYYGSYDCSRKIKAQLGWGNFIKGEVWSEIIRDKIMKQVELLEELKKSEEARLVSSYLNHVENYDVTNREGHAAKVYFNALFGKGFTRSDDNVTNAALNYGYSIILSAFNREIVSSGYLTQCGLFHDNMFNYYNLSCDLMESFRILVDRNVIKNNFSEFGSLEKHILIDILNQLVIIDSQHQTVLNAIRIYVHSVFEALNDSDISIIKKYKIYEL